MKRLVVLVMTTALAAVLLAPAASARHTLKHRVGALEGKLSCMAWAPMAQFPDYAWFGINDEPVFDPSDPDTFPTEPLVNWGAVTGIDLAYGMPFDLRVLTVRNTRACRTKFRRLANPAPMRSSARLNALRLARAQ